MRIQKLIVLPAAALAFTLSSCSKNTPKDVAKEWLTDFYHMDFESAKKYSTDETKVMLSTIEGFSASFADSIRQNAKKVTITVKSVREEGDKAYVTFSASNDPNATEPPLKLIKQNEKWLVQFSKNDFKADDNAGDSGNNSGVTITTGTPANTDTAAVLDSGAK